MMILSYYVEFVGLCLMYQMEFGADIKSKENIGMKV